MTFVPYPGNAPAVNALLVSMWHRCPAPTRTWRHPVYPVATYGAHFAAL